MSEFLQYPYGKKPYADGTLRKMKKDELIQIIRDCEHNYRGLYWIYENSVRASERVFRTIGNLKLLRRITDRDIEGKAFVRPGLWWIDPLSRLALLEDFVEEWIKEADEK